MDRSENERGGGRLFQRRRPCRFCLEKAPIDFKDAGLLRNFFDGARKNRSAPYFRELHASSA